MSTINNNPFTFTFQDTDDFWTITVSWRRCRVGYIWCNRDGVRLQINDFKVQNHVLAPWPIAHKFICFFKTPTKTKNFRGYGIGSRLMNEVFTHAEETGITEIWGSVTPNDILATPYLLMFYQKRGFAIREPDGECIKGAIHKIVRTQV